MSAVHTAKRCGGAASAAQLLMLMGWWQLNRRGHSRPPASPARRGHSRPDIIQCILCAEILTVTVFTNYTRIVYQLWAKEKLINPKSYWDRAHVRK